MLTEDEKKLLAKEGVSLPTQLPLTKVGPTAPGKGSPHPGCGVGGPSPDPHPINGAGEGLEHIWL